MLVLSPSQWTVVACLVVAVISQTDRTREAGTYGSDVVEGVMGALKDACIFPDSKLFLRRLAFVESQDGVNHNTYRPGYDGGIWQVDEVVFNMTKAMIHTSLLEVIKHKLGIDWTKTSWVDLRKPLYSGLTAAIYFNQKGAPRTIPSDITQQGSFWQTHYRPNKYSEEFVNRANQLAKGCDTNEKMDLLFLIDSTPNEFFNTSHVQTFMKNYISSMTISSRNVQVAVITYGSIPQVNVPLTSHQDQRTLLGDIDNIAVSSGKANLSKALDVASSNVFQTSTSRGDVAKVMVLLTGESMTVSRADILSSFGLKNKGIHIYVVGTKFNIEALSQIASEPTCAHRYIVGNVHSLEDLRPYFAHTSCRVPVGLEVGEYSYPCGSNLLVRVQGSSVGVTVKVFTDNGKVHVYGSYANSQPSSDLNDITKMASLIQPASIFIRDKRPLTVSVISERHHLVSCQGSIHVSVTAAVLKRSECQNKKPDIVILLDSSTKNTQADFDNMVEFVSRFSNQFEIGPNAAQIGLATYSDQPMNQFWLKTFNKQSDIQRAIRREMRYHNSSNLAIALKFVREQAMTPVNGERSDSSKLLILVTGSSPQHEIEVLREARLLHNEGIRVIVVAASTDATINPVLKGVASGIEHFQQLHDFGQFPGAVNKAVVESCGDVQLICIEEGLQRSCHIEDLLNSQFGSLIVPEHGTIINSPCAFKLPHGFNIERFPHPIDTDKFILCDNKGHTYVVLCPINQIYNGDTTDCELPHHTTRPAAATVTTTSQATTSQATTTMRVLSQSTIKINRHSSSKTPGTNAYSLSTKATPTLGSTTASSIGTTQPTSSACSGESLANGEYFHPYFPNPHMYIHCTGMPQASKLEPCAPLKIWRQEVRQCQLEYITDQDGHAEMDIHNPCLLDQPSYFPHPFNNTLYIQCDAFGEGFVESCQSRTVFLPLQGVCGNPHVAYKASVDKNNNVI